MCRFCYQILLFQEGGGLFKGKDDTVFATLVGLRTMLGIAQAKWIIPHQPDTTLFNEFDLTVSNSEDGKRLLKGISEKHPSFLAITQDSTAWRGLKCFLSLPTNSLGSQAEPGTLLNNVNVRL